MKKQTRYLNLGGGYTRIDGYENVDFRKITKPEHLIDLESERCLKKFKANSIYGIVASHILEHIHNLEGLMSEIYRVCRPGARVIIRVPHYGNRVAIEDPTHIRSFSERSMMYYDKSTIGSDCQPITIPYNFKLIHIELYPEKSYQNMRFDEFVEASTKYLNVVSQIQFTLEINK